MRRILSTVGADVVHATTPNVRHAIAISVEACRRRIFVEVSRAAGEAAGYLKFRFLWPVWDDF